MDKVYRGGICNLAACDTSDSNGSFFSSRQPQLGAPIVHQQTFVDCSSVFTIIPDWPQIVLDQCNLYKRGWVMQERWLSPHIIHFSQFPIWECNDGIATEGFPPRHNDADGFKQFSISPLSERRWLFPQDDSMSCNIYRWWNIISNYSKCSLTYASDKLVAIGGMARVFSVTAKEPYYAGIWGGKYLIRSLLWFREERAPLQDATIVSNNGYLVTSENNFCLVFSQYVC